MGQQKQHNNPTGKRPFFMAILLMVVAILLGFAIFYGMSSFQKLGIEEKSNRSQVPEGNNIVATVAPTVVPTIHPTLQPSPTLLPTSTPVRTEEPETKIPVKVKGIYVTGPRAGSRDAMDDLIDLVDTTELNAMVIDIKNDSGEITYKMNNDTVKEIGAGTAYIHDIKKLIKRLKKKDIYLIARVVAFKDPLLAEKKPELTLMKYDGTVFKDKSGLKWVNPYKKEVWKYLVGVASEAAKLGFDEIQFDYIRFSTDSGMEHVNFGKAGQEKSKAQIITEFTEYAYKKLSKYGVYVSADVFGIIINSKIDAKNVGQNYGKMAQRLDYICPMIYPSHYADGTYKIAHPDTQPYDVILHALMDSKKVLNKVGTNQKVAIVRPWLQDFTASWLEHHIEYNKTEIRAQIKAVHDAGYEEWILWNGSNHYTKEGLLKK